MKRQIFPHRGLLTSAAYFLTEPSPRPPKYQSATEWNVQEFVARLGKGSGMIGEGFETVSFPFRKPLIQKTEES
jgi:hypothetical protein